MTKYLCGLELPSGKPLISKSNKIVVIQECSDLSHMHQPKRRSVALRYSLRALIFIFYSHSSLDALSHYEAVKKLEFWRFRRYFLADFENHRRLKRPTCRFRRGWFSKDAKKIIKSAMNLYFFTASMGCKSVDLTASRNMKTAYLQIYISHKIYVDACVVEFML